MHTDVNSLQFYNRINWEVLVGLNNLEDYQKFQDDSSQHDFIYFKPQKTLRRNISRSLPKIEGDFYSFPVCSIEISGDTKTPGDIRPHKKLFKPKSKSRINKGRRTFQVVRDFRHFLTRRGEGGS